MRTNIGYLQLVDKFAREAVLDLPADATPAERARLMKAASDARLAHARAVAAITPDRRFA